MRYLSLLAAALCLSLAGCDQERASIVKRTTPADDESFARRHVELLRQQAFTEVEQDFDASLMRPDIGNKLAAMAAMFPHGEPKSVKVVGVVFRRGSGPPMDSITLEYEFPEQWILVNVAIEKTGGVSRIVGFHSTPISESLEEVNKFRLAGKGPLQYAVLFIAIGLPIFCIYTLVLCLRSKNASRKWLWVPFILLGVGKFAINWTTGECSFTPLAVSLLGTLITANPAYGPWMVSVSFPLGALLFLLRQN
jgi:hypothetical protein